MLAKIGEIVRQVALIALLTAFLEMLLPEKRMISYVRLVLGLFVVVAILTPLVEGFRFGPELDVTAWDLRLEAPGPAPIEQGRQMARANEEAALEIYRERLAGQIKALVGLVPGVKAAEVLVSVAGEGERLGAIRRVVVTVITGTSPPVEPVEAQGEAKPGPAPGAGGQAEPAREKSGLPGSPLETPDLAGPGSQLPPVSREPPAGVAKASGGEVEALQAKIKAMVAYFYSLDPGQVEVIIRK
ncbi:MAG: stage sporulation protein [Clostridia bacterium]|nr:stage sporulation protein [Clostridia bacterium]